MQRGILTLYEKLRGDKVIWFILILLCFSSLLAVYSATGSMAYRLDGHSTEYYLIKQLVIIILGLGVAFIAHRVHYEYYLQLAPYVYVITVGLLIFTLFFGVEVNSARRWIRLPFIGLTFQASDLAKVALILMLARVLSIQNFVTTELNRFWTLIFMIGLVCLLIAPMNFSTAAMLFTTAMVVLFIGKVNMKYLILSVLVIGIFVAGLFVLGSYFPDFIRSETWINRLQGFLGGHNGYQITQSKIAIADGGLFGVGPGNSDQRNFLPSPYSDFIYAIICEEYGIIGGASIMIIYLLFLYRVTRLINRCKRKFGVLVAYGLCFGILFQAFLNIGVSVGLMPVTGLTLPVVSMGGSSMIITCLAFGIILSVSNYTETSLTQKLEPVDVDAENDELNDESNN